MKLTIIGSQTPELEVFYGDLVGWLSNDLIPPAKADKVKLLLEFSDKIHRTGMFGKAEILSKGKVLRDFKLTVTKTGLELMYQIVTVCHEMVHIKQWVMGEFIPVTGDTVTWKGTHYSVMDDDYDHSPWEYDAYSQERVLAMRFCKEQNLVNMPWYVCLWNHM